MKIHEYKHQLWLYKDTSLWSRIKKELPIILIFLLLAGVITLIGSYEQARVQKQRVESKYFTISPN